MGFSKEKLIQAKQFADENLQTAAVIIISENQIVYEWGEIHRVNTWERNRVTGAEFGKLLQMILDARL